MSGPAQRVAYVRVSSVGQNLGRQLETVGECDRIFQETESGARTDRPVLRDCITYVRQGDTLVIPSIDRLGRDHQHMLEVLDQLATKGVDVEFCSEGLTIRADRADPTSRLVVMILSAVSEADRLRIRERQAEGIALAKRQGKYRGRARKLEGDELREVRNKALAGVPKAQIAREHHISRQTLYRYLEQPRIPLAPDPTEAPE